MKVHRRKAISYIMSVAIMTFVTLAMASVVLVWSLGQTATSQNTFASAINANEAKAEERYTIEQVLFLANGNSGGGYSCTNANGCLVLYVRNVGSIQLVCDAVYVNNQLALQSNYATGGTGSTTVPATAPGSRLSLGIQQLGSIGVPAPFLLKSGVTYTISASTTRGNVVTVVQTY